jgi:hypothetical protein
MRRFGLRVHWQGRDKIIRRGTSAQGSSQRGFSWVPCATGLRPRPHELLSLAGFPIPRDSKRRK